MATIHYFSVLRQRLQEEIDKETQRIAGGYSDFTIYREQVGYLKGLKAVLMIVDDIEQGLN